MKRNKAHDAMRYVFQRGENILIDANVWLYLQPPAMQPPPGFAWRYSAIFKKLLAAGAKPVIESVVLGEYLNRYLRIEYDARWASTYGKFKLFRNSGDFTALAQAAVSDARTILSFAAAQDVPFSRSDIADILTETEAGRLDFNDGVITETCRLNGWKLLTNDGDMTQGGIEVLTTYRRLLTACPP
jgi:predicted nucleic acid-binding protein